MAQMCWHFAVAALALVLTLAHDLHDFPCGDRFSDRAQALGVGGQLVPVDGLPVVTLGLPEGVAGLRASDRRHRQRGGRRVERAGAVRPRMAAAIVSLAGPPDGVLVDPCCGTGAVLAEADAVGRQVHGFDVDPDAVAAARANVPRVTATEGDSRRLDLADGQVQAARATSLD